MPGRDAATRLSVLLPLTSPCRFALAENPRIHARASRVAYRGPIPMHASTHAPLMLRIAAPYACMHPRTRASTPTQSLAPAPARPSAALPPHRRRDRQGNGRTRSDFARRRRLTQPSRGPHRLRLVERGRGSIVALPLVPLNASRQCLPGLRVPGLVPQAQRPQRTVPAPRPPSAGRRISHRRRGPGAAAGRLRAGAGGQLRVASGAACGSRRSAARSGGAFDHLTDKARAGAWSGQRQATRISDGDASGTAGPAAARVATTVSLSLPFSLSLSLSLSLSGDASGTAGPAAGPRGTLARSTRAAARADVTGKVARPVEQGRPRTRGSAH